MVLVALISACNPPVIPAMGDSGLELSDAGPPDAGFDPTIGGPCATASDCHDGQVCIAGFPGGYCTEDCSETGVCEPGSVCRPDLNGGPSYCFRECDPEVTARQCRAEYTCGTESPAICLPGCYDETDCGDGQFCSELSHGNRCRSEDAELGDACVVNEDCGDLGSCYSEWRTGFPGGLCAVVTQCAVSTSEGCPDDSVCLPLSAGGLTGCFPGCDSDDDCRADYSCKTSPETGRGVCWTALRVERLGEPCETATCDNGTCLTEVATGYPGSFCTDDECDPVADTGCPSGGHCVSLHGRVACHPGCEDDHECRDGYACRLVDESLAAGPRACVPACADGDCGGGACDWETGLCE